MASTGLDQPAPNAPERDMAPAFILVRPQLGMNIGMAARAMANFGCDDLRLVAPRDGWPNPEAGPAAAGADQLLENASVAGDLTQALADCHLSFATTIRPRDMAKPVITPRQAAAAIRSAAARGLKSAILFGPERAGLTVDDIVPVNAIVTAPVNPGFGSLNLAQAVLLLAYEWFQAEAPQQPAQPTHVPAPYAELAGLVEHLNWTLDAAGYFHIPDRTPATKRTLAQMLGRPGFSSEEVRTLRGVIRALADHRQRRG